MVSRTEKNTMIEVKPRCKWAGSDPLLIEYHDREWGVPVHDDRLLFEFLILEGAQAGLSWTTILRKRDCYRLAFDSFNPSVIANYDDAKVEDLLASQGIVRNHRKIEAAIDNAKAFLEVQEEYGSFEVYTWRFVGNRPIQNSWKSMADLPAEMPESMQMNSDLKKRGFKFVGPTICYAFMQAVGMVNDHTVDCFRYSEISSNSA